jgi:phosphatidylserine/phosphatidylglycerophosphate/cardiolipin synthase-like enzyme
MTQGTRHKQPPTQAVRYRDTVSHPDKVEWLIDNSRAYESILLAVRNSHESIRISQLAFDADCVAYGAADVGNAVASEGALLLDAILEASSTNHVNVEILLNSTLLLDTASPLRRSIAKSGRDTSRVEVRGFSRFPQLLHAKMVIVDEKKAFLMGSPFVNGYWDDSSHAPVDRRRPPRELGGRPLHDVSMAVEGEVVHELAAVFTDLWNVAGRDGTGSHSLAVPRSASQARESCIRAVTTLPSGPFRGNRSRALRADSDDGSVEILEALLSAIGRAEHLIYIEHQYLSSRPVVAALRDALARHRDLEIIMVLNQNPDVTAYRGWQNARLTESGMLRHPRVGLYTLWSAAEGRSDAGVMLNQVFVHSKVVVVDNHWAIVGSANLDGVSLDSYGSDFSSGLLGRIFRDVRNVDVALVVNDGVRGSTSSGSAGGLRSRLWREHLGPDAGAYAPRAESGWVALWQQIARENIAMLNSSISDKLAARTLILPYSMKSTPRAQLKDVGMSAPFALQYEPGWLEVHWSPAWVRNMFL